MISEGNDSDSEDWSNDAENTTLIIEINYILKYIKIENHFKYFPTLFFFYCMFDEINAGLMSITLFSKNKNSNVQTFVHACIFF